MDYWSGELPASRLPGVAQRLPRRKKRPWIPPPTQLLFTYHSSLPSRPIRNRQDITITCLPKPKLHNMEHMSSMALYSLARVAQNKVEEESRQPEPDLRRLLHSANLVESAMRKLGAPERPSAGPGGETAEDGQGDSDLDSDSDSDSSSDPGEELDLFRPLERHPSRKPAMPVEALGGVMRTLSTSRMSTSGNRRVWDPTTPAALQQGGLLSSTTTPTARRTSRGHHRQKPPSTSVWRKLSRNGRRRNARKTSAWRDRSGPKPATQKSPATSLSSLFVYVIPCRGAGQPSRQGRGALSAARYCVEG